MDAKNLAATKPPLIAAALAERRCLPEDVLEHIEEEADLIAGMANCEPATVLDAIDRKSVV